MSIKIIQLKRFRDDVTNIISEEFQIICFSRQRAEPPVVHRVIIGGNLKAALAKAKRAGEQWTINQEKIHDRLFPI